MLRLLKLSRCSMDMLAYIFGLTLFLLSGKFGCLVTHRFVLDDDELVYHDQMTN